jgi:hypothetical protein
MDLKKNKKISLAMSFMFIFSIIFSGNVKVQAAVEDNIAPAVKNVSVDKRESTMGNIILVTVEAEDDNSGLAQEANLCYIVKTENGEVEKGIKLSIVDGKYVGEINIDKTYPLGTWKISFITVEDKEKNVSIVYNSRVHTELDSMSSAKLQNLSGGDFENIDLSIDALAPELLTIKVDDNQIQKYDNVKIIVDASDDLSGLAEEANLCYISMVGGKEVEKEVSLTLVNGKYQGTITIDESYGTGNWLVSFITLQDNEGNVNVIYNSEVHSELGQDLSSANLYLNEDIVSPKVKAISVEKVSGKEENDTVIVKVQASDDMSGLAEDANLCYVLQKDNKDIEQEVALTFKDGQYIGEINLDDSFIVGEWKVSFITLQDKANNVAVIYNAKVHEGMGIDLSAGNINLSQDTSAPMFQGISVNTNIVNLYDTLVVEVRAIDNSGLEEEANLCYVSEVDGKVVEKEVVLKLENGKYIGRLPIDETYKVGNWRVSFITLQDKLGNVSIVYNSDVHKGLGTDLSKADLSAKVEGAYLLFNKVYVSTQMAFLGDKVQVVVEATDKAAELKETANLCYVLTTPLGDVEREVTLNLVDGKYVGSIDVDESYYSGLWKISFITIEDVKGNLIVVYNNKVHEGIGTNLSTGDINTLIDLLVEAPVVEGLKLGSKAKVSVKTTSGLAQAQDVTLIVGIYDNSHRLIKYVTTTPYRLTRGGNIELTAEVDIPVTGTYKLKVFVWDSIERMTSLTNAIEYTVE